MGCYELPRSVQSASDERQCSTSRIGEFLMNRLRDVDKVAYVRFASVYREFEDEQEFLSELAQLVAKDPK